jgi:hypothetical protein
MPLPNKLLGLHYNDIIILRCRIPRVATPLQMAYSNNIFSDNCLHVCSKQCGIVVIIYRRYKTVLPCSQPQRILTLEHGQN